MVWKRFIDFLPALIFLPLLHTEGGSSYPPEGGDCQIANTGFPIYWLQADGQCCSCHEGIVKCQEVLPCLQLPQNVAGCNIINVCGCDWLLCNDTQSTEGETEEESGINNPGQEVGVVTYDTDTRRKREVINNGTSHHHHRHPNPILKQAKGGTKGNKAKGGTKGNKGKGGSKASKGKGTSKGGKGTSKGGKGKGTGTKGSGKGSKGKGTSKGKGKGSKGKGSSKGKGGKGGMSTTPTPTTPKGDNTSYDYYSYSYSYSYSYNYPDYTYNTGAPKTKGKKKSRKPRASYGIQGINEQE